MFGLTQLKINDLRQDKTGYNLPWRQLSCTFRGWSLQEYNFGDVQNVDFFFIFQIFSRAFKVFIKPFHPWSYSAKNQ